MPDTGLAERAAAAVTSGPIRIVMLGCGAFARHYHVPTFLADPEARIEAIFDPFPNEEVVALAERCGARLAGRLDELPRPDGPVLALVTTPHALHAGHVRAALERGWHVLCDKPFVLHARQARDLAAEADRRGALNAVAFNRRLDPGGLRAREIFRSGGIGPVRYVETVQLGYPKNGWIRDPALAGGGPFTGRGTHMADLVPWLLDRCPSQVRARLRDGDGGQVDRGGFLEVLFGASKAAHLRGGGLDHVGRGARVRRGRAPRAAPSARPRHGLGDAVARGPRHASGALAPTRRPARRPATPSMRCAGGEAWPAASQRRFPPSPSSKPPSPRHAKTGAGGTYHLTGGCPRRRPNGRGTVQAASWNSHGDGRQPVKVFEPPAGPGRAGVIVYMDAFGWRDELDGMAARYAERDTSPFFRTSTTAGRGALRPTAG
jgi:predicted dehydrogenase